MDADQAVLVVFSGNAMMFLRYVAMFFIVPVALMG
jgi:hypothetical protein